jgi:hypothetical protein
MKRLFFVCTLATLFIFQSCTPTLSDQMRALGFQPIPSGVRIQVMDQKTSLPTDATFVGDLKLDEEPSDHVCNYHQVIELSKEAARAFGANIILLTEVREVKDGKVCHHIKGEMYRSEGAALARN